MAVKKVKHTVTLTSANKRTGLCSNCGQVSLIKRTKGLKKTRWICKIQADSWRTKTWKDYPKYDQLKDPKLGLIPVPPGTRERIFELQKGLCAICKKKLVGSNKALDHCHSTGKIRGYLCRNCNWAIGLLDDNIEVIRQAAFYIEQHK